MIALVNMLYDQKNYILICTARGTGSNINHRHLTKNQLDKWGVKYHKLVFGRIVSDKVITPEEFLNEV
jgi:hypothetical protein